jgi:hypothetical protein
MSHPTRFRLAAILTAATLGAGLLVAPAAIAAVAAVAAVTEATDPCDWIDVSLDDFMVWDGPGTAP